MESAEKTKEVTSLMRSEVLIIPESLAAFLYFPEPNVPPQAPDFLASCLPTCRVTFLTARGCERGKDGGACRWSPISCIVAVAASVSAPASRPILYASSPGPTTVAAAPAEVPASLTHRAIGCDCTCNAYAQHWTCGHIDAVLLLWNQQASASRGRGVELPPLRASSSGVTGIDAAREREVGETGTSPLVLFSYKFINAFQARLLADRIDTCAGMEHDCVSETGRIEKPLVTIGTVDGSGQSRSQWPTLNAQLSGMTAVCSSGRHPGKIVGDDEVILKDGACVAYHGAGPEYVGGASGFSIGKPVSTRAAMGIRSGASTSFTPLAVRGSGAGSGSRGSPPRPGLRGRGGGNKRGRKE